MKRNINMLILATGMVAGTMSVQSCNTNKDKETSSATINRDEAPKESANPKVAETIKMAFKLLGIEVPERM